MLELLDLDKRIDKETYRKVYPELEVQLGECQRQLRAAGIPVVVAFEGWDAAGKGTLINRLTQTLDPRGFKVHVVQRPSQNERFYPWMWRYWNSLPATGDITIFDHSWYHRVLSARFERQVSPMQCDQAHNDIVHFERQLADTGVIVVKFWLHISRQEQRRRFKRLLRSPATAWRVAKHERRQHKHYDEWLEAAEEMFQRTSTGHTPWHVVEATQGRYTRIRVFETLVDVLQRELKRRAEAPKTVLVPMAEPVDSPTRQQTILDRVDLSLSLSRDEYEEQLDNLQQRAGQLQNRLFLARKPAVIVYQGWDAAGKGGNIKRMTAGLDPRGYEVVPVAAPTPEEKAQHFLWRFWRRVPKAGHVAIFDRSWYGRVMVERVEGFCTEEEWQRAYREINEFERQLVDFGAVIVKFWLHIDQDEQLRRFEARQNTPSKQWKITDEDWRNREKWNKYKVSVVDMLKQTSTTFAPWTILEANNKLYARIKGLRTVIAAWERALKDAK